MLPVRFADEGRGRGECNRRNDLWEPSVGIIWGTTGR